MPSKQLTFTPVITSPSTVITHEEVFRIVQVRVESILDAVDHSGFQVNEDGPGYVVLVVRLVEEHIFAIIPVRGVFL